MKTKHDTLTDELAERIALSALGSDPPPEAEAWERHLDECEVCRRERDEILEALATLAASLPKTEPSPELKTRLLDRVKRADAISATPITTAPGLDFKSLVWEPSASDGVSFHWLRRDPSTGTLVALARLREGCSFPHHSHVGGEDCFILQGAFSEAGREYRAGQLVYYPPGSQHGDFRVLPGGDLILLVVSHGGIGPPLPETKT